MIVKAWVLLCLTPTSPLCTLARSPHSNHSDHYINRSQTSFVPRTKHCWDFPSTHSRSQNPHTSHLLFPGPELLFPRIPPWLTPSLHSGPCAKAPSKERLFLIPEMVSHPIIVYTTYLFLFFVAPPKIFIVITEHLLYKIYINLYFIIYVPILECKLY